ncbi:hypothetical protein GI582_00005, partial [Sulfitobacter sp. BDSS02]|nr:hypothetical protein [Sulfitobacter sp. BDSS02]
VAPCPCRTSTCRSFDTISSGFSRFPAIADPPICGTNLSQLVDHFQGATPEGQSLSFDVEQGQHYVIKGNVQMLQQMLVNLIQNAVTHGPIGNVISVTLNRSDGIIRLAVADKGPGIPEVQRESVFEPFLRLDLSRSKPGSGLGLALVRAIVEKHSGTVMLGNNHPGLIVLVTLPSLGS